MRTRSIVAKGLPVFAVVACGKLLGVDRYETAPPRPADGSDGAPFDFRDVTCGTCVKEFCTPELQACQLENRCAVWEGCMADCSPGDGACENRCFVDAGGTNLAMGNIATCTFEHCYDENQCQASGAWSGQGAECSKAVRDNCPTQADACRKDEGCRDVMRCVFENGCVVSPPGAAGVSTGIRGLNPSCIHQCLDQIRAYDPDVTGDGGLARTATIDQALCMATNVAVAAACREGESECVGRYDWAAPEPEIQVEVLVTNGPMAEVPGEPLADLPIRACRVIWPPCGELLGFGPPTGPDGRTTLTIGSLSGGVDSYFELLPGSFAGVRKVLYHKGRQLSVDTTISLAVPTWLLAAGTSEYRFKEIGPWSEDHGAIFAKAVSCNLRVLLGAEFRLEGAAASLPIYYLVLNYDPMGRSESTTSVYIPGVPEGLHTLSAWRGEQEVVRSNVVVEKDALSFVDLLPKDAL